MTQTPAPLPTQEEVEAFTVLALRYFDGDCSPEDVQKLKEAVVGSSFSRELFVHVCRVQGNLHEAHATRRTEFQQKTARVFVLPATVDSPASDDPGADTMVGELSAEDTAHPEAKPK